MGDVGIGGREQETGAQCLAPWARTRRFGVTVGDVRGAGRDHTFNRWGVDLDL